MIVSQTTIRQAQDLNNFLRESNAIEGVYDDDSLTQALCAWSYLIQQEQLTVGVVLKTHKILMLNQPLMPNQKGYLRTIPVYIGGREAMHYSQIRKALGSWCKRANLQADFPGSRIEEDIEHHHVEYERIHPFVDGNGRTGRIFMNWQRVKAGLPILIIKEKEKHQYYRWFEEQSDD